MAQIPKYLYSNLNRGPSYLWNYNPSYIDRSKNNNELPLRNIYSNYPLFNNEIQNENINYYDFSNNLNTPLSYLQKREKPYKSKSSEQDLDMMKLQFRCDLIGQKISQIQNQVQNFQESTSKEFKKILRKHRTYDNLNQNKDNNIDKNNGEKQYNLLSKFEKNNFFKIPFSIRKEKGLNDTFRKKRNENNIKSHNISYINNKIGSDHFLINDYNDKTNNEITNNNFRQTSFFNFTSLNNKKQPGPENNMRKKYNKIIINKINSNPNLIKSKENKIVQINNYINDFNDKYKNIPNSSEKNKNKIIKSQIMKRNYSAKGSMSSNISPNKIGTIKNRKINEIKKKNSENILNSNSTTYYGSFDKYFFNDNNYNDSSYIKYIDGIKNNFNNINYTDLNKVKEHSFNTDKLGISNINNQNHLVIQKGYDFKIINKQQIKNKKNDNKKANTTAKKYQPMNNYKNSINMAKTFNFAMNTNNKIINKGNINNKTNRNLKKNQTQINNNFNVNNNTNYYNFNYNQSNNNINHSKGIKNIKNKKKGDIKSKNYNLNLHPKNQNIIFKENTEENSTKDYVKYNHDYSNDEQINTSDLFNSINGDKNIGIIKKSNLIYEKKVKINMNSKKKSPI